MFEQFDFFSSHGGRNQYFKRKNRILQDLLLYLESFKVITSGQKP